MLEAECALATFTIKVGVLMFDDTVAVVATYIIFQASASVVNSMNQFVEQKCGQGSRDGTFIHRWQQSLQLG